MNVNALIIGLENIVELPVEQDYYDGSDKEWITFTYADERYTNFGDDEPIAEEVQIQIKVALLKTTDYLQLKEDIKAYLRNNGAFDINSQSYMDPTDDKQKYRILLINCRFVETI